MCTYLDSTPDIHWHDYGDMIGICAGFAIGKKSFIVLASNYFTILIPSLFQLVFTLIMTVVMQWLTKIVVYTFLALGAALLVGLTIYTWYIYSQDPTTSKLFGAILMTVGMVFWIGFIIFLKGKIALVLALYEIAASILYDQPLVILISVVVSEVNTEKIRLNTSHLPSLSSASWSTWLAVWPLEQCSW